MNADKAKLSKKRIALYIRKEKRLKHNELKSVSRN